MDATEPETTAFDAVSAHTNRLMRVRILLYPQASLPPVFTPEFSRFLIAKFFPEIPILP
jgi:hypothetical protein